MKTAVHFESKKVMKSLKRIFGCAVCPQNKILFTVFLASIPVFYIADYIEVTNIEYQVRVFEGKNGYSMKDLIVRTAIESGIRFIATIITDLSSAEFFHTGLEQSLKDFLGMKWTSFHKYTTGEHLVMQYEKSQSISKFIFEVLINLVANSIKLGIVINNILQKVNRSFVSRSLIACLILHLILFLLFFKTKKILQSNLVQAKGKTRSILENESSNFEVVKTYNLERISAERVAAGMEQRRVAKMNLACFDAKTKLIYKSFEFITFSSIFALNNQGFLHISLVNTLLKQSVVLYETLKNILNCLNEISKEFTTFYILENIMDVTKQEELRSLDQINEIFCDNLEIDGVFEKFSIKITENQKIAIVGKNGSGKTLLMRILTGLCESSGKVKINSKKMESFNPKDIARLITYISQNESYTQGSIFKNLQYGNQLTRDQIIEKCEEFGVDKIFNKIDGGYDKLSGSLGKDLSGGQKQRVSYMRGILRNTPVLIVDDCFSCISTEDKESLIEKTINFNDKTLIMTCDRFENLHKFDQIILLGTEESKVGTFKSLEKDLKIHFKAL